MEVIQMVEHKPTPAVDTEAQDLPCALHCQLHELLDTVAVCEAEWALDNRIALSVRLRAA
jgi:hypothetical protein